MNRVNYLSSAMRAVRAAILLFLLPASAAAQDADGFYLSTNFALTWRSGPT